ncbi:MAG: cell division protein FtsZ [Candidatus Kapaibacterium sp.]
MSIQLLPHELNGARIKVVGIGGGGGNILNSMVDRGIEGVEFIAINTDSQALDISKADVKIQIGKTITKGLGTGANTVLGDKAAEESREEIGRALAGSDMVFITAGMGGGTGTGASPLIAKLAKSLDILVVAIVTKPFGFEGNPRMQAALDGIEKLKREVDSLIIVPNQRIRELIHEKATKNQALALANIVLYNATKGISQIITKTGEINVDFADVKTTMKNTGDAIIGTGIANGEGRAMRAVGEALSNPILENVDLSGAKNVLVNIASDGNIGFDEIDLINSQVQDAVGEKANYIFGLMDDNDIDDGEIMVTVIATGFKKEHAELTNDNTSENEYKNVIGMDDIRNGRGRLESIPEDIRTLDTPAVLRRKDSVKDMINDDLSDNQTNSFKKGIDKYGFNSDDLKDVDPPAFLRRSLD